MFMYISFNAFHINDYVSLLNALIHIVLSISHHTVLIISSYIISTSNLIQELSMHCRYARAAVGYSPASFFALSPRLIDRSRRKTLHTLH